MEPPKDGNSKPSSVKYLWTTYGDLGDFFVLHADMVRNACLFRNFGISYIYYHQGQVDLVAHIVFHDLILYV